MNKKFIAYLFFVVLSILLLIEAWSYWQLKKSGNNLPFFFNYHHSTEIEDAKEIGFNEIHPLWGWNMSDKTIESHNYISKNALIELNTNNPADTTLKIFITGGSTSDIVLDQNNWPKALHNLLTQKKIPHSIYVAAVGGFNSSQEYLRLIEQGLEIKPHLHISYAGANETGDFGFVTEYERDFYVKSISNGIGSFILPNTIFFLKTRLFKNKNTLQLAALPEYPTSHRFKKNFKLMQATAQQFGYTFLGVLQPLNGIGNHHSSYSKISNQEYLEDYKRYYPEMQDFVSANPSFLQDFTTLFDSVNTQVYVDDCHLVPGGNKLVASKMYILINEKILKAN